MPRRSLAFSPARLVRALSDQTRGATAIEYGLILAVIALTLAAGLSQVATALRATFDLIAGYLFVTR